jgi:hypothetical protein
MKNINRLFFLLLFISLTSCDLFSEHEEKKLFARYSGIIIGAIIFGIISFFRNQASERKRENHLSSFKSMDKSTILKEFEKNNPFLNLSLVSDELRNDKDVVLLAIQKQGVNFRHAHESLRKDRELISEAVRSYCNMLTKPTINFPLKYVDKEILMDRNFAFSMVEINGNVLEFLDPQFQNDREFVLTAVKTYGGALEFVNEHFKVDQEIIEEALKNNGMAIKYVDITLKQDKTLVLLAIKSNVDSFKYISVKSKNDPDIMLQAVKLSEDVLKYVDRPVYKNKEIFRELVKVNGLSLKHADPSLKKDKEIVLDAVRNNKLALQYADKSLQKDKDILSAIQI